MMNSNTDRKKFKPYLWQSAFIATGSVLLVGLAGCNSTQTTPTATTSASPSTPTTSPQVSNPDATPTNSPTTNSKDPNKQIVGQWQGKYEGKNIVMVFSPGSKLVASVEGEKKVFELFYRLDTTTTPFQFDVFENSDTLAKGEVTKTILEYTPEGRLRIQMEGTNPKTPRPTSFNDKATVLTKISDSTDLPQNLQTNISPVNQLTKAIQAEGKTYVGSLNRASQAYFVEMNSFTGDIDKLGVGIPKESRNYSYSLVLVDAKKAVQTIAIAKRDDVKSYTGLTYVTSDNSTNRIVCESDRPTTQKPAPPEIVNNQAICPTGYTQWQ
jgi:hypothetical protein